MPFLSLSRQSSSKSSKSEKSSKSSSNSSKISKSPSTTTKDSHKEARTSRNSGYSSVGQNSSSPTSPNTSPRPSHARTTSKSSSSGGAKVVVQQQQQRPQPPSSDHSYYSHDEDLSPGTSTYPRSSVETYASTNPSQEDLPNEFDDPDTMDYEYHHQDIPPLPIYRREVVEPNVRPTTAQEFARLFPSMNRFSIRHDEFTPDGNMNLRVDAIVQSGRRRTAMQLFHLRMYDLSRREFSLRRYCRDSGRELCNSKRKYSKPAPVAATNSEDSRPSLQRSMTSAIKTFSSRPQSKRSQSSPSTTTTTSSKRPSTRGSYSSGDGDDEYSYGASGSGSGKKSKKVSGGAAVVLPTNTIKLEFSNYARVDVERRGKSKNGSSGSNPKRYDFEWWGHKYSWRRATERHTGVVSFHLLRDGKEGKPIAHIVPETRSPVQMVVDEEAGGWVPPCHMWINDKTVLNAMTDVADVIMATGLMALVDDCIKERWETRKIHRIPVPLTSRTVEVEYVGPKAFMQHVFGRRNSSSSSSNSDKHHRHDSHYDDQYYEYETPNPISHRHPISAY